MTYTLTRHPGTIRRDADGALIPNHPGNMDYLAYLAWVEAGNEPNPVPEGGAPGIEVTGFRQAGRHHKPPKGRRK